MFTVRDEDEGRERVLALKPMNCPGHVQIFHQGLHSYRELPLRMAEFGSCHRNEPSGALHGIMRVRAFTQDDAHIFCTEDQITAETIAFCNLLRAVYRDFGFDDVRSSSPTGRRCAPAPTRSGTRPRRALKRRGRGGRPRLYAQPRRRRLLRAEARIRAARRDRPRLAMRHAAGRFRPARAARCQLYRRGRAAPPAGHAAPRHLRLAGALHRHPDRALCRALPALAGAGASGGGHDHVAMPTPMPRRCGAACAPPACGSRSICATRRSTTRSASTAWPRSRLMLVVGQREAETGSGRAAPPGRQRAGSPCAGRGHR